MPDFAHVHGQIHAVAELDEMCDSLLACTSAIAMAGVHEFVVVGRVFKWCKIAVPLRTSEENDVVGIYFADSFHAALVQRLYKGVERIFVFPVVWDRLIDKFVAENCGLVLVAVGNIAPNVAHQLLALLALKEPGVTIAVVDVVARLSAGCIVHVENEI